VLVAAVTEHVEERAGQKNEERQPPEQVSAVFGDQKERRDCGEADKREP
jgi:hypothetical protein